MNVIYLFKTLIQNSFYFLSLKYKNFKQLLKDNNFRKNYLKQIKLR